MGLNKTLLAMIIGSMGNGSSASPVWLTAATLNRYPLTASPMMAGMTGIAFRYPVKIGSGNPKKLRLCLNNAYMLSSGELSITNSVFISQIVLERTTGSMVVPVYFGGSRSYELTAGAVDVQSDEILPSAFGLTEFTKGDNFWVKGVATVASNSHKFPGAQGIQAGAAQRMWQFNASTDSWTTEAYGVFTHAIGSNALTAQASPALYGFSPIVLGLFDSPVKCFLALGDSIISDDSGTNGNYMAYAAKNASDGPHALLFCSTPGSSQVQWNNGTLWKAMLKYATIMVDELGTNAPSTGITVHFPAIWAAARAAGVKKIHKTKLLPKTYCYGTTTSLTHVGTTATLKIASGTLPPVGASIRVLGATPADYTGMFLVTARDTSAGTFSYSLVSDPVTNATGAIYWNDRWRTEENQTPVDQATYAAFDAQMVAYVGSLIDGTLDLNTLRAASSFYKWAATNPEIPADGWATYNAIGLHPALAAHTVLGPEAAANFAAMSL